jgi:hypothetical protein
MTRLRPLAGGAALAAGLWLLTAAAAAPPDLPKEAYKAAIEADIDTIQKLLNGGMPDKRAVPTIKAQAMILAVYGEATGNAALTAQALKVAEELAKKPADFKAADAAAKELSNPKGGTPPKGPIHTLHRFDLADAMAAFRLGKVGGLNIEADIREGAKKQAADPKAAQLLATRTAVIGEFTVQMPVEKATANPGNKAKWDKLSKEMIAISKEIAEEAGKGGADPKKLGALYRKLDTNCTNCHNDFRD